YTLPALSDISQVRGGTPYGASTIAGGDGSRQPSAVELDIARHQGETVARLAARLKDRGEAAALRALPASEPVAPVGSVQLQPRPRRYYAGGVDGGVAAVIVLLDVLQVESAGHARPLVELPQIPREIGVILDALQVALDVHMVDCIEADQGSEQTPVRLGQGVAQQIPPGCQTLLQLVQGLEQSLEGLLIGLLAGSKSSAVDPIVDPVIDARIERVDLPAQALWIVVTRPGTEVIEGAVEHADDIGRFIADDPLALPIPEHRNRHPAAVIGRVCGIDLMQVLGLVDGVGHHPVIGFEGPAVLGHQRVDHRHRDHPLQPLEYPEDQGAMGPGAGQRYIQMIAPGFGPEAILPGWPGPAIGGHPVAEPGLAADELTLVGFGVVPLVDPLALDQQSHGNTPFSCLMRTGAGGRAGTPAVAELDPEGHDRPVGAVLKAQ